ncbi:NADPH:quinone reductase [Labrys miyagiensis]|uniref:NADPH:quinone reductase n=1 Tax=Labrys miyagiensis TaxID=346912 RepID=A0ABQ6CSH0_9HYPH|nr:NADP-dependent oxidoreductase [Labrys miyagiensis]GLS23321.1 NADPH:quinone reductase [Labrys miyagiensis]
MQDNRAHRIHAYGGPEVMSFDTVPVPAPGAGQVLVQVQAAGVNGLDWKVREGFVRDAFPLALPATLGIELAGIVTATGAGATCFKLGDRVMGPLAGLGAYADFVAVDEGKLCLTPAELSDVQAAALPVAALTAWQALRAEGDLRPGQAVLIHGASGGVGSFAVQFAKAAGATVLATASGSSRDYLIDLGADRVFDRHAERFEDHTGDIDLVLDLVGGDAVDRSWSVLSDGGAIVSTAAFDIAGRISSGRKGQFFMMKPDAIQLSAIAGMVASGRLQSAIAEVVDHAGLAAALERNRTGHAPGKIALDLTL